MALIPVYEHHSYIESRFAVDPALVTALTDRLTLQNAETLALTTPYGDQSSGFQAGQLCRLIEAPGAPTNTVVAVANGGDAATAANVTRGVFADSLTNALRTFGKVTVGSVNTVMVSFYARQGAFRTDVFHANLNAVVAPSTLLFSTTTGELALIADAGNASANAIARIDISPGATGAVASTDFSPFNQTAGQLHFSLI